jgi:hypothetical protein
MKIDEVLSFDQYWNDPRFTRKRPMLQGSKKQAFGDNIYHRNFHTGEWVQANSHHSLNDGSPNERNIKKDTQAPNVLIGSRYAYWGGEGPPVPPSLRNLQGEDIVCSRQGHKNRFSAAMVRAFTAWCDSTGAQGCIATPGDWDLSG